MPFAEDLPDLVGETARSEASEPLGRNTTEGPQRPVSAGAPSTAWSPDSTAGAPGCCHTFESTRAHSAMVSHLQALTRRSGQFVRV